MSIPQSVDGMHLLKWGPVTFDFMKTLTISHLQL